jgi:transcriptional regulator with XRE-family HTH domain
MQISHTKLRLYTPGMRMPWLEKLVKEKSDAQKELLGELLRSARKMKGLTQTEAAAHVVRDQTFIARIESGSQWATFVEVEQLAQAYGKQLSDFQTIHLIEQRNRNFAIRPDAVADYTDLLLENRQQRRKPKRHRPKQRPRRRKRS